MPDDTLEILIRARGGREAGAEAEAAAGGVQKVGAATQDAQKKTGLLGRAWGGLTRQGGLLSRAAGGVWRGLKAVARYAKWAALGLGALAVVAGKKAVTATVGLAKTTIALRKQFGLSIGTASELGAVLQARGVDTKQLNTSFATLAKTIQAGAGGGKAQIRLFRQLGITHRQLRAGHTEELLFQVAEGLSRIDNRARRTAIGSRLFGRGWQTLLPLLVRGRKGLQDQLDTARKYGATFRGRPIKSVREMIAAQREAKLATLGLQIAFATQLAPWLTKGILLFSRLARQFQDGTGTGGKIRDVLAQLGPILARDAQHVLSVALAIVHFTEHHQGILKVVAALALVGTTIRGVGLAARLLSLDHVFSLLGRLAKTRAGQRVQQEIIGQLRRVPGLSKAALGGVRGVLRRIMGRAGTSAGQVAAENVASGVASGTRSGLNRRAPGLRGFMTRWGRGLGAAAGIAAALIISQKIDEGIRGKQLEGGLHAKGGVTTPTDVNPLKKWVARPVEKFLGLKAMGGFVPAGSSAIVGDAGPEFARATPGGVQIIPLDRRPFAGGWDGGGEGAPPGLPPTVVEVHSHLDLDGREVAHSVGRVVADRRARR